MSGQVPCQGVLPDWPWSGKYTDLPVLETYFRSAHGRPLHHCWCLEWVFMRFCLFSEPVFDSTKYDLVAHSRVPVCMCVWMYTSMCL